MLPIISWLTCRPLTSTSVSWSLRTRFGLLWTSKTPLILSFLVITLYSKLNSKQAAHSWVDKSTSVTELSNILVCLFWHNQCENSTDYSSFSELWHLSRSQQAYPNKCYALLSPSSFLYHIGALQSIGHTDRSHELHGRSNHVFRLFLRSLHLINSGVGGLSKKPQKGQS